MSTTETPTGAGAHRESRPQLDTTELARLRSIMAADRTLLAWSRTALALVAFGFTLYKVLRDLRLDNGRWELGEGARVRNLSLALIAIGTISLCLASFEHAHQLRALGQSRSNVASNLPVLLAGFVILFGVLAVVGVLSRLGPF